MALGMEDVKVVNQILVYTILDKEHHHIAARCGYMPLVLLYAEREEIGDICVSLRHCLQSYRKHWNSKVFRKFVYLRFSSYSNSNSSASRWRKRLPVIDLVKQTPSRLLMVNRNKLYSPYRKCFRLFVLSLLYGNKIHYPCEEKLLPLRG